MAFLRPLLDRFSRFFIGTQFFFLPLELMEILRHPPGHFELEDERDHKRDKEREIIGEHAPKQGSRQRGKPCRTRGDKTTRRQGADHDGEHIIEPAGRSGSRNPNHRGDRKACREENHPKTGGIIGKTGAEAFEQEIRDRVIAEHRHEANEAGKDEMLLVRENLMETFLGIVAISGKRGDLLLEHFLQKGDPGEGDHDFNDPVLHMVVGPDQEGESQGQQIEEIAHRHHRDESARVHPFDVFEGAHLEAFDEIREEKERDDGVDVGDDEVGAEGGEDRPRALVGRDADVLEEIDLKGLTPGRKRGDAAIKVLAHADLIGVGERRLDFEGMAKNIERKRIEDEIGDNQEESTEKPDPVVVLGNLVESERKIPNIAEVDKKNDDESGQGDQNDQRKNQFGAVLLLPLFPNQGQRFLAFLVAGTLIFHPLMPSGFFSSYRSKGKSRK